MLLGARHPEIVTVLEWLKKKFDFNNLLKLQNSRLSIFKFYYCICGQYRLNTFN